MSRQEIDKTNAQFAEAFKRRDIAAMGEVYTNDAKVLPPNGETVTGKEAIKTFWQGGLNMGMQGATLKTVELEILDNTAIEIGAYTLDIGLPDGGTMTDRGKFVVIWKKQPDGTWKWHIDIFNSNLPAPTG